jgi:hypothetical protein
MKKLKDKNKFYSFRTDPLVIILNCILLVVIITAELWPPAKETAKEIFLRQMGGTMNPPLTFGQKIHWYHWCFVFIMLNSILISIDNGNFDVNKGIKIGAGKCPNCFKTVNRLASKCPYCTADI